MESFKKEAKKDLEHKEIFVFFLHHPLKMENIYLYMYTTKRDIIK